MPIIREQPQPPKRVFALATPSHLMRKLYWEISNLKKCISIQHEDKYNHLEAAYYAFNAAVTAWHISDWAWESLGEQGREYVANNLKLADCKLSDFQNYLKKHSWELTVCCAIANGSKHKTDRGEVEVKMDWSFIDDKDETQSKFVYNLVLIDGDSKKDIIEVFELTCKVWHRYLSDWGFEEPRLVTGDEEEFE